MKHAPIPRRNFLLGFTPLIASVYFGRSLLPKMFAAVIPLTLPAAHMRERAIAVRDDFINNYLQPKTPYPLLRIFQSTSMLPYPDPGHLLGKRLVTRGGGNLRVVGTTLINEAPQTLRAPFTALVCDRKLAINVAFPKKIEIATTVVSQTLELRFVSPIYLTLNTPTFECNGQQINLFGQQVLETISVSNAAAILVTRSSITPSRKFRLTLDFTRDSFPGVKRIGTSLRSIITNVRKSFVVLMLACGLVLGPACQFDTNSNGNTNTGPSCPQIKTSEGCGPTPAGWVVTGHTWMSQCGGTGIGHNYYYRAKALDPDLVITPSCPTYQIEACVDSNVGMLPPPGWNIVGYKTDFIVCTQPFGGSQNNIALLQKLP